MVSEAPARDPADVRSRARGCQLAQKPGQAPDLRLAEARERSLRLPIDCAVESADGVIGGVSEQDLAADADAFLEGRFKVNWTSGRMSARSASASRRSSSVVPLASAS